MSNGFNARFAAALVIKEQGKIVFDGAAGDVAISRQPFDVGQLGVKKKPPPKSVIGALTLVWGFKNRLQMRAQGEFIAAAFDGRCDPAYVHIPVVSEGGEGDGPPSGGDLSA